MVGMGNLLGKPVNQEDGETVSRGTTRPRFGHWCVLESEGGGGGWGGKVTKVVWVCTLSHSNSLRPQRLWPARLLCPRDLSGKNTGAGGHFLLQGIFLPRDQTRVSYISCIDRWEASKRWQFVANIPLLQCWSSRAILSFWQCCLGAHIGEHIYLLKTLILPTF